MVSQSRNFDDKVNLIISIFNASIKNKAKNADLKKAISKRLKASVEQWQQLYWLYYNDENEIIANAIVSHALDGKVPVKGKIPLCVKFYWANGRIKKEVLNSLPFGEGRINFNAKLIETIDLIEKTYRSSGDRYLPKVTFGDYAIKLTGKENCRYLYKIFNDGEAAVIFHVWHGTSADPNPKLTATAKKASASCSKFDPKTAIEINPGGEWIFEAIEIGELLDFAILNEAKEKF